MEKARRLKISMGLMTLVSVILLMTLAPLTVMATDYSIAGNGTNFTALKTLVEDAGPGDRILVSGTFEFTDRIVVDPGVEIVGDGTAVFKPAPGVNINNGCLLRLDGGTKVQNITFEGEFPGGDDVFAILASVKTGVSNHTITIDNVTFRDITQSQARVASPGGIQIDAYYNDNDVEVTNCTFSNIQRYCVYVASAASSFVADLNMSDCTLSGTPGDPMNVIESGIIVDGRNGPTSAELTNVTFSGFEYNGTATGWTGAALYLQDGGEATVTDCSFSNPDPTDYYDIAVEDGCSLTINSSLDAHSIWINGDDEGVNGTPLATVTDNTGEWILVRDGGDRTAAITYPDARVKVAFQLDADNPADQAIDQGTTTTATVDATSSFTASAPVNGLNGLTMTYSLDGAAPVTITLNGDPSEPVSFDLTGLAPGTYSVELKLYFNGVLKDTQTVTFTISERIPTPPNPGTSGSPNTPLTGDTGQPVLWVILLVVSLAMIIMIRRYAVRKEKSDRKYR